MAVVEEQRRQPACVLVHSRSKDGSRAVSGRISVGFGSRGFGFGDDFSPTVFGFGAPKPIGFGFPPVDIQWISEISH